MRDWASKRTADWWEQADIRYRNRLDNEPSESYMQKFYNFDSAMEIGSGTGRLINSLSGRRGALDINKYLLRNVDNQVLKYHYDISKPLSLDVKYDLVYTFQVLQHLNHSQFLQALKNIKKLAAKEIWLMEGQVPGYKDGDMTHGTGSYHHDYHKYLKCYQIDSLHGGKIKVFRAKV